MPELIAEGRQPRQRWRIELHPERTYAVGRDPTAELPVMWDEHISRRHAELILHDGRLSVRQLSSSTNPLFFAGRQVETCELTVGEHFVLGNTCFILSDAALPPSASAQPVEEVTFSRGALQHVRFRDPDRRIEVLSHLPELIWGARSDSEMYPQLVNLLLAGIPQAESAAIVSVDADESVRLFQWDRRRETEGAFRPSSRLVTEAILNRKQSVLHVWEGAVHQQEFTIAQGADWAFCTPIPGPANERWGLYLAGELDKSPGALSGASGSQSDGQHLQADVKFAELVAEIVGSVRRLNHLERQQAGLRQFFPPVILSALGENLDAEMLAPRESDVTVLFCDLRGFSRQAEVSRDDLIGLLDRVSQALGVMTRHILQHGGVIGDFQGDAAMGFWGWPVASEDAPLRAARAALGIRAAFTATARQAGHPLADFEMGIGLARGKAVAGKIGTNEHVKVTVFGPVVNLASRLEGMTKQLRVPIIIDEALAKLLRERMPASEGRTRQLAKVLPYGMETPVTVSELLPGDQDAPELTSAHLASYEQAVEHFIAGRWDEAYRTLRDLPPSDRAQDFLAMLIAQHNRVAPSDWTGVVRLPNK